MNARCETARDAKTTAPSVVLSDMDGGWSAGPARVLVTGGAGFIGRVLVRELVRRGAFVRVLDDLSGASCGGARTHGALPPGVELRVGSATCSRTVAAAMAGCDTVVHLAAIVGVRRVVERPTAALATNWSGTRVVALEAHRRGARLLVASSSEVLGTAARAGRVAMAESDATLVGAGASSRWSYAIAKLAGERLVEAVAALGALPALCVRFFNTTGPGQSPRSGMVLPAMAADALTRGVVEVHGDGRQVRSFCHVDDAVRALLALLEAPRALWDGRVFHVGSDRPIAVGALAERIAARTGARVVKVSHERVFGPGFEDVRVRVPDLARLRAAVGWRPRIELEALIDEVLRAGEASAGEGTGARRRPLGSGTA